MLACRCFVGIEVLDWGHSGTRLADCTAVGGTWIAGSQTAALERRALLGLGLPHILI